MHIVDVTLTSENVERSVACWADLGAYSGDELDRVLPVLRGLFATRCARGSICTVDGVTSGCGMSAFVHAEVLDEALAAPEPLLTKRLLVAAASRPDRSPFLAPADIGEGNARRGLHLLILQANVDDSAGVGEVLRGWLTRAFYRLHDGYRLVRVAGEYVGPMAVGVTRSGEFELVHEFSSAVTGIDVETALVVLTPERAASATMQTFVYSPPTILFTAGEQELLRCALDGAPDDIVARRLGVTLSSVKARWTRVQQRAMQMAPHLFETVPRPKQPHQRGAQTRHLVLEYVRAHPSELTPYLRDHEQTSARSRATLQTSGADRESRDARQTPHTPAGDNALPRRPPDADVW
jgi:hypothetical protein